MDAEIKKILSEKEVPMELNKLRDHVLGLIGKSRGDMSVYYKEWDNRHETYRAKKPLDRKDVDNKESGEPAKQIVPLTFAQCDTFVAFGMMNLLQRDRLFELKHTGTEDKTKVPVGEKLLDRDMKKNNQNYVLHQSLTDLAKFGLSVIKCCWVNEYDYIPVQEIVAPAKLVGGVETEPAKTKTVWKKVPTWTGNKLLNLSPYRVFPDTRVPLTRYQEGEFLGIEEEMSLIQLKKQEKFGMYAGVDHIEPFSVESMEKRKQAKGVNRLQFVKADGSDKENVCVLEVFVDLIPSKTQIKEGIALGEEDFPVRYVVSIANDDRIIRCEPYTYLSRVFPVFLAQFTPDLHELVNESLSGMICKLQEVADWFFNSRVASVVRTLNNQLVVDPSGLEMDTVKSNSRVILMKKSAARQDPRRFVHQLAVSDVTGRHMDDMSTTAGIIPQITGVSEQAMGVVSQGRRSAYEMRSVNNASSGRMKKVVSLLWEMQLTPLGVCMLTNHRQGIDQNTFVNVLGESEDPMAFQNFKGTPEQLVSSYDMFIYDGTLPSDKLYLSQSLQEIFSIIMTNPQAALQFNIDPKLVFEEMYRLRGVEPKDFAFQGNNMMNTLIQTIQQQLATQQNGGPGQDNSGASAQPSGGGDSLY